MLTQSNPTLAANRLHPTNFLAIPPRRLYLIISNDNINESSIWYITNSRSVQWLNYSFKILILWPKPFPAFFLPLFLLRFYLIFQSQWLSKKYNLPLFRSITRTNLNPSSLCWSSMTSPSTPQAAPSNLSKNKELP